MIHYVNSRDERQALFALEVRTHVQCAQAVWPSAPNPRASFAQRALQLLDACVKNCGYPLHKQIGTKKFLNGLVRQFTERAPVRPCAHTAMCKAAIAWC